MAEATHVGGYEVNLLDHIDERYTCPFCHLLVRDPVQTLCGQLMCVSCHGNLQSGENKTFNCPACKKIHEAEVVYPDKFSAREIRSFRTACEYTQCPWKGEVCDFEAHVADCKYVEIKCPNKRCQEMVPKNRHAEHIQLECNYRTVQCSQCEKMVILADLTQGHLNECSEQKVTNSNGCTTGQSPKQELDTHLQECRLSACPFAFAGCEFEGLPDQMDFHLEEDATLHLEMAVETFINLQKKYSCLKECFEKVNNTATDLDEKFAASLAINKENNAKLAVLTEQQKQLKGDFDNIRSRLRKLQESLEKEQPESTTSAHDDLAILKDQADMAERRMEIIETKGVEPEESDFLPSLLSSSQLPVERQLENIDKQLAMQDVEITELNSQLQLLEATSYTGVMLWTIDNIEQRRNDAMRGKTPSFFSPPFYIGRFGYKACARIYLHGDGMGKGKFVSLFFTLMRGDYDALLLWPFQQKVTFKVFDLQNQNHIIETFRPDPYSVSFRRPVSEMNLAAGFQTFVEQSVIFGRGNESPYIKNDTLYVEITVDTTGLQLEY